MTERTQVTPDTGHDEVPAAELTPARGDQDPGMRTVPADAAARLMIPVAQLAAHPGNVRADLDLTP
jgi:hypothetical protein